MIINGDALVKLCPVMPMPLQKYQNNGISWGLSEAGIDIRIKQTITLDSHNKFSLASSIEYFQMPNNLVGILHDKSTWARKGLSVFNTVIEPNFFGGLTLELVYHGIDRIVIPAGSGIGQVIFHEIKEPAWYNGKYQGQSVNPEPARGKIGFA